MLSKLEVTLLNPAPDRRLRERFLNHLFRIDNGKTLRRVRAVNTNIHDLVDSRLNIIFRDLYLMAPSVDSLPDKALDRIAGFCETLTISVHRDRRKLDNTSAASSVASSNSSGKVRNTKRRLKTALARRSTWLNWKPVIEDIPPLTKQTRAARRSAIPSQSLEALKYTQDVSCGRWIYLFSHCPRLHVLTIKVKGNSAWPGRSGVERTVITLRAALEQSTLPKLIEVRLAPIHAMGIIHLRWAGLGAYSPLNPLNVCREFCIWQKLQVLDIKLLNPLRKEKLTAAQELMFKRSLYDYVRSFSRTLQVLRFSWLEGEGPSPITLHYEEGVGAERGVLHFERLEEMWLANVTFPQRIIAAARAGAPKLRNLMMLRATRRDHTVTYSDKDAWLDLLSSGDRGRQVCVTSRASSIYSQESGLGGCKD